MSLEGLRGSRILIIHQGALGDFILALPAVSALREALQPAWLEIMGHPWILQLVEGRYYTDAIADVNKAEVAPFFQEGAQLPEGMRRYFSGFDAAFVFGKGATFAHNLRQAGVQDVFLLPPFPEERIHLMDHHLRSLAALGICPTPSPPRILLRAEDRQWAEDLLRRRRWTLDEIIALHPGAGSRYKVWPAHRLASLGKILARTGRKLLIIQGPADEEVVGEVLGGLNGVPHMVVRDLPLIKLGALLEHTSFFIGNDSGISHLAAALGVPTLAIFGPTDPLVWAPRGPSAFWLRGEADCSPGRVQQRQECERQRCLEGIGVGDLVEFLTQRMKLPLEGVFNEGRGLPTTGMSHHIMEQEAIPQNQ